ncbi:oleoyl-ACP hydrolase [Streptomyces sp. WM6372]|uniref:thioesterase II family protein n=1 Tax=Streptomyces sp. WM6372 TaxID=1415555 RepID=UPI0006AF9BAC|nr:alpha/beta fold hydrolase [Streptomyces sp. WM6372]KOU12862.1 oleoyl-ACP hydrolase [Streptomyces sp. WM6372]
MTETLQGTSAWIRRFQPSPDAPHRLVCFPHAGGAATFWFPMAQALAPQVDVLAVQYPGRQDRRGEPCIEDIETLAAHAAEEVLAWSDRPVTLFGHSMGAMVAFETARRLEERGRPPAGLVVSGMRAPSRARGGSSQAETAEELVAGILRLRGTDAAVLDDPELVRMILPTIRSDYKAAESYRWRPGPPLGTPIAVLTGTEDPHVSTDEAAAWREHTAGPFSLTVFTGGHFFLNEHAEAVRKVVTDHIARSFQANSV